MNIETWADGLGRWHARVPVSGNENANARLAHAAILWELAQRGREPRFNVVIDAITEEREGTAVYVEKD